MNRLKYHLTNKSYFHAWTLVSDSPNDYISIEFCFLKKKPDFKDKLVFYLGIQLPNFNFVIPKSLIYQNGISRIYTSM